MLPRLRHDGLVGGDNQQGQIDTPDPGQHVVDEVLVARHVDYAHLVAIGEAQPGESKVNGQPPLLLLAEPVRVDASQRLDEGRFAMINVPGGADYVHGKRPCRLRLPLG